MNEEALNLVGYCGLNCAVCFSYKMTVSESAKALRRELRSAKLKTFWDEIPFLGEHEPFKKALDGLTMRRGTKACRGGGGNPFCKIRKCCQKKAINGCWECDVFESYDKLNERYVKNLKKIKRVGVEGYAGAGEK